VLDALAFVVRNVAHRALIVLQQPIDPRGRFPLRDIRRLN
jgi:hypothetical protein